MKTKMKNLKNTISENRSDIAFYTAMTAMIGGVIYASVKIEQAEQKKIQAAREAGCTVVETPWGNVIF